MRIINCFSGIEIIFKPKKKDQDSEINNNIASEMSKYKNIDTEPKAICEILKEYKLILKSDNGHILTYTCKKVSTK